MKKTFLVLVASLAVFSFSSCEKCLKDCELIPAKVIRYDCDRVIFQLLTREMLGDNTWTDVNNGQVYHNVVSYYNTCEIAAITNGEYNTIYVKAEKTEQSHPVDECIQCQAISNQPPVTKMIFKEISTEPCEPIMD